MEIRKSKETLILTQEEKAVLSKSYEILDKIYDKSECGGDIEDYAEGAKDNIMYLLKGAEIEGGEPSGAINVVIMM